MATTTRRAARVAEICLYGTTDARVGAGWLAALPDGRMLGTGEPVAGRTFTEAIFRALGALEAIGVSGPVRVFDAGGERMADMSEPTIYGALAWKAAPVYSLELGEIGNLDQVGRR